MEDKPSIREERMKAGVEADKPGAKAWMEAAEAGMEAAEAGVEATAKTSMKPAEAPMESQGWVRRASAIANATDAAPMAFNMDLRIGAPLRNPHGAAPSPSERRRSARLTDTTPGGGGFFDHNLMMRRALTGCRYRRFRVGAGLRNG
jgi:hypothetical protein